MDYSFCSQGINHYTGDSCSRNECRQTAEGEEGMDQVKIGRFIAELRKEKSLTQRELAELMGVSDRTVSKWETGNGMPEISMLMPLCQALQINVNELLSGERLSDDSYSRKAEENIMNLIQETEKHKKQNLRTIINAVLIIILSFIAVVTVVTLSLFWAMGSEMKEWHRYFLDLPSVLPLLLAAVIVMSATKMWRPFFRAFGIVFAHKEYSIGEVNGSAISLRMLENVWLIAGISVTVIPLIIILHQFDISLARETATSFGIGILLSASIKPLTYGLLGKLLLLPIRSRLEFLAEKLKYQA